ncbi:MAG: phosphoenolpyruvate carboxykinase (ATP) [candidate division Zixibacteria bacterium]|nr:phosphoenolpyruvate carboxykinase (ATP) [candidate division Zixibacteria bacterium]
MTSSNFLSELGVKTPGELKWNYSASQLIEDAVRGKHGIMAEGGAFAVLTGKHTGRSPKDKFIVLDSNTEDSVWWGDHNKSISKENFDKVLKRIVDHLEKRELYIQDLYAGADSKYRLSVRVVTETPWHSLFAQNLFIQIEDKSELAKFGSDFTIINVPTCLGNPEEDGLRSESFVLVDFTSKLVLIGGTSYAGEIKKSIFTVMNFLMPKRGVMSMHCSANEGKNGDTAIFFGLSGTGKTTLSADPGRILIGDDEHGWSDKGVFNYEGGCYAKVIRLSKEGEPDIYQATQSFGTILENVVIDPDTRKIQYDDDKHTENTRAAYPIKYIRNSSKTGRGAHPSNIILLTADAFGVLPPVAKLTPEMTMKYFLVGYTAKVAGTEKGVTEPTATFSPCFGAPFMALHPIVYAELLARKISEHKSDSWLINTGWCGGPYGIGERISLKHTRAIVNATLDGTLATVETRTDPIFGFEVPVSCPDVPDSILNPIDSWDDKEEYRRKARELSDKFDSVHASIVEPNSVPATV